MLYPTGIVTQLELLGIVFAASVLLFWFALRTFQRLEGNFAEEL
jgi:hypothetical protein